MSDARLSLCSSEAAAFLLANDSNPLLFQHNLELGKTQHNPLLFHQPSAPARSGTEASAQSGTHSARSDAPGGCHDALLPEKMEKS